MDFMRKRFGSLLGILLYVVIILVVIFLFVSILPFILLLGLIVWLAFKVSKIRNKKKGSSSNSINGTEFDNNVDGENSSSSEIIDVEYKEVK